MPYRDWLKLQEIDWQDVPPPAAGGTKAASATVPAGARQPERPGRVRRLIGWGLAAVATAVGIGLGLPGGTPTPGKASSPAEPSAGSPPPLAPAPAESDPPDASGSEQALPPPAAVASVPQEAAPTVSPAPPPSPLAQVLDRQPGAPESLVVLASRAHDFSRSGPSPDDFHCLKLSDPENEGISTRAYLAVAPAGDLAPSALPPWGQHRIATVRLQWRDGDPATGTNGHWRILAFDDAAPGAVSAMVRR